MKKKGGMNMKRWMKMLLLPVTAAAALLVWLWLRRKQK